MIPEKESLRDPGEFLYSLYSVLRKICEDKNPSVNYLFVVGAYQGGIGKLKPLASFSLCDLMQHATVPVFESSLDKRTEEIYSKQVTSPRDVERLVISKSMVADKDEVERFVKAAIAAANYDSSGGWGYDEVVLVNQEGFVYGTGKCYPLGADELSRRMPHADVFSINGSVKHYKDGKLKKEINPTRKGLAYAV